jgi:hypothetical protein
MDDDLTWSYRRWRAADDGERDDDADAAFRSVFHAVRTEPRVPPHFTERTMAAIAGAAQGDAVRARRTRAAVVSGSVLGGATAAYYGAGFAISTVAAGFLRLLDLVVAVIVGAAAGVDAGADFWSMLASLGRAAAAFAADPKVTFVILVVQGVAIAALFALQRLLGSNGESFE